MLEVICYFMLQVFVEHLDGPQSQRNVFDYRGFARSRPLRCSDDVSVAGGEFGTVALCHYIVR